MSTLLKAISASDSIISISEDPSLPQVNGVLQIESELISYTDRYLGTLYGCVRGLRGTSAASHAINISVFLVDFYGGESLTDITATNGVITQSQTYSGSGSNQGIASDETLDTTAGKDKGDGGSFQASIMGNVHATNLSKTGNYVAGVIGAYSVSGTNASELPTGAVIGDVQDPATLIGGIFTAVIDGNDPSGVTRAGAAFKARSLNNNAGSGVNYGLDLFDSAVSGYLTDPTLPLAISNADIRMTHEVCILNGSGIPTTAGTGFATAGSLYVDYTNGDLYINDGSKATPAWKLVPSTDVEVTGKLLTNFSSGAGVITSSDSILTSIDKLDGNVAARLPLAGGTMTGAFIPWNISETSRDALFTAAIPSGTITYGTPSNGSTIVITGLPTDGPQTFTKVAALPGANEFSSVAELTALLDGLTDLNASEAGGVITLVVATKGTAMNAAAITGTSSYSSLNITFSGGTQPAKGTMIYNTTSDKLNVFTTLWEAITSA